VLSLKGIFGRNHADISINTKKTGIKDDGNCAKDVVSAFCIVPLSFSGMVTGTIYIQYG